MSAVVISFPEPAIVAAYRVLRRPEIQDDLQVALACSVLVEAIRRGETVPSDTTDRLVRLVVRRATPAEYQVRRVEHLAQSQRAGLLFDMEVSPERGAGV